MEQLGVSDAFDAAMHVEPFRAAPIVEDAHSAGTRQPVAIVERSAMAAGVADKAARGDDP
jgi:hypothetical protein